MRPCREMRPRREMQPNSWVGLVAMAWRRLMVRGAAVTVEDDPGGHTAASRGGHVERVGDKLGA